MVYRSLGFAAVVTAACSHAGWMIALGWGGSTMLAGQTQAAEGEEPPLAAIPDIHGPMSYSPHAATWSAKAEAGSDDGDDTPEELQQRVYNLRMAAFHAPENFGMWRNLASQLSKLARAILDDGGVGSDEAARKLLQEAGSAFKVANFLGDSAAADGYAILKEEVFAGIFGPDACIDVLDEDCKRDSVEAEALIMIENVTTAYDGIKLACSSLKSYTIKLSKEEIRRGQISAANLYRGLVSLKICGVLIVDNALADERGVGLLQTIEDHYKSTSNTELERQEQKAGIKARGKNRWELVMPIRGATVDVGIIANPFVMPFVKALMRTGGIEIENLANLITFPDSGYSPWVREMIDPWAPPADDETSVRNYRPQGIAALVPLSSQKVKDGLHEIAIGSHMGVDLFGVQDDQHYRHLPKTKLPLKKGSVALLDARLLYKINPNKGKAKTQTIRVNYVQDWYTDLTNDKPHVGEDFDYLPSVLHQKLLYRLGLRKYIRSLEDAAREIGIDVDAMKSTYRFDRTSLSA